MTLEQQIFQKKQELNALKRITALTDSMKIQLNEMANQVSQMETNAETVSQVMENWNSITRSISQAGLSLLQYAERDYEVGVWNTDNEKSNGTVGHTEKVAPLPETLVRVRIEDEENVSNELNGS